jgi:hypothetical protein
MAPMVYSRAVGKLFHESNLNWKISYQVPFKDVVRSKLYFHPNVAFRLHTHSLKGTVSRDFLLLVFFMNQFPFSH